MYFQILIILAIIGIIGECYFISLWIAARRRFVKKFKKYTPPACVIIPCKGLEKGIESNLNEFCSQHYPTYNVVFVVDSKKDPVYKVLTKIKDNYSNVSVEITKPQKNCSGKIAALITGIESTSSTEVIVFADCDIKPENNWLQNLIEPLQDEKIGASTGYRWYFPSDFKTQLISTWNMASIAFLFHPKYNFTWGGSTAIKKTIFDDLDIKNKWKNAYSDDLVITNAIRNSEYYIYFQPKCIMESIPETSLTKFNEWGSRQYTWLRWYYPKIWLPSFIGLVGIKSLTILGILLIILGFYVPGLLMVMIVIFEMIFGWQGIATLQNLMVYPKKRFTSKIYYPLTAPIVFFIIVQNMIISLFKKEITWAGRSYKRLK